MLNNQSLNFDIGTSPQRIASNTIYNGIIYNGKIRATPECERFVSNGCGYTKSSNINTISHNFTCT